MPTTKLALTDADWTLLSSGGNPTLSFRGIAECRLYIGTSKPSLQANDFRLFRYADGPEHIPLAYGVSLWARANEREVANLDVTDAGASDGAKKQYTLLATANATGAAIGPISGGDYIWRAESANWGTAVATLQFLGLDGATWYNVKDNANADVKLSANGSKGIGVAQGSMIRVSLSAAPTQPINSAIGGL